jgi:hypothetical protein
MPLVNRQEEKGKSSGLKNPLPIRQQEDKV